MSARSATCSMPRRPPAISRRWASARRAAARSMRCRRRSRAAVYDKQRSDELQIAQLASRGVPTAPIKSGRDGGMHPTFVAKLRPQQVVDERGNVKLVVDKNNPSPVVAYSAAVQPEAELTTSRSVIGQCAAAALGTADQGRRAAGGRAELRRAARKLLPRRQQRRPRNPQQRVAQRRTGCAQGRAQARRRARPRFRA